MYDQATRTSAKTGRHLLTILQLDISLLPPFESPKNGVRLNVAGVISQFSFKRAFSDQRLQSDNKKQIVELFTPTPTPRKKGTTDMGKIRDRDGVEHGDRKSQRIFQTNNKNTHKEKKKKKKKKKLATTQTGK
uniref:Uncharacterized protein n=1 Tax=Palpitomonas bilix TaxID=652834 RepID=A0A7S3D094_9EUKA|mmetsp:Transcript_16221/g.41084  ORF Transcript_16221/g.41084 Transcript_16221/m.41084 type:complete len:133 (+) Transcript_16221:1573-1971(+)